MENNDIVERLRLYANASIIDGGLASVFRAYLNIAADEIERLRRGGCARDQRTTQFCAEAVALQELIEQLRRERDELCEALREISQMKDEPYSAEFAVDTLHHVRLVRKA